ncbi:hypothetical protein P3T16_005423 [Paraburkholderia sp. GAS42]
MFIGRLTTGLASAASYATREDARDEIGLVLTFRTKTPTSIRL